MAARRWWVGDGWVGYAWAGGLVGLLWAAPLLAALGFALAALVDQPGKTLAFLYQEQRLAGSLALSLWVALGSTGLALLTALSLVRICLDRPRLTGWIFRLQPLGLSIPHLGLAVGLAFLVAPSGWLARMAAHLGGLLSGGLLSGADGPVWTAPPLGWLPPQDPFGLTMIILLAAKEAPYLLFCALTALSATRINRQAQVAASLGHDPDSQWRSLYLPQLLPRLGLPLLAVLAYGLGVVDLALVLAPTTPPPLAVLIWDWSRDPLAARDGPAIAASLILLVCLGLIALTVRSLWPVLRRWLVRPGNGARLPKGRRLLRWLALWPYLLLVAAILMLAVWSLTPRWPFPDLAPPRLTLAGWQAAWPGLWPRLGTALALAVGSTALAMAACLAWLEAHPQPYRWEQAIASVPLILPPTLIAAGLYRGLLALDPAPTAQGAGLAWAGTLIAHLLYTLPYAYLALAVPYRRFDKRLTAVAESLGHPRLRVLVRIKWPLLAGPICAAAAIALTVSLSNYVATALIGGGRIETLATEAVALSAGGDRMQLALYALLQSIIPVAIFALATRRGRFSAQPQEAAS